MKFRVKQNFIQVYKKKGVINIKNLQAIQNVEIAAFFYFATCLVVVFCLHIGN